MVIENAPRKPLAAVAPEVRSAGTGTTPATVTVMGAPAPARTAPAATAPTQGNMQTTGVVRGFWGFDRFEGPTLPLQRLPGRNWAVATQGDLFTGRSNTIALTSTGAACVAFIALTEGNSSHPLDWHANEADAKPTISVKLPLEKTAPGGLSLAVRQFGDPQPQAVPLTAYADAVRVDDAVAHAADTWLTLRGTGLGSVSAATLNGLRFAPHADAATDDHQVRMDATPDPGKTGTPFKAGDHGTVELTLRDGRTLRAPFHVDAARPAITLLNVSFQPGSQAGLPVTLGDPHSIPLDGRLTLALRSDTPTRFARTGKVEVAAVDGSASVLLSLQDRTLVLQDARTALGYVTPSATFGPSGFGPLQLRVVAPDGATSDWIALGTLTRTPVLRSFACGARTTGAHPVVGAMVEPPTTPPASAEPTATPCTLSGSDLFLIDAVASNAAFSPAVEVPAGFALDTLSVPRPADGHTLYLRLRDDPDHAASVQVEPPKPRL